MPPSTRVGFLALFLGAAVSARADTVVFRTGERLRGTVVTEQPGSIRFDTEALGPIDIPRERIAQVERDTAPAAISAPTAPAGPVPVAATPEAATRSRDFLRFYTDHGVKYEFVQPVSLPNPLDHKTKVIKESIAVRGRLGIKASFDVAAFDSSKGQQEVGSDAEVRTLRLYTTGDLGLLRTNHFTVDLGWAGREFYLHDANIRYPDVPYAGAVTIGYLSVPQTLANVIGFGASAFMEASSPAQAFSPGERIGIQLDRTYLSERMTAAVGLFSIGQDPSANFGDATDALARPTARLTGLLWDNPDLHQRFHLGGSASFVFSDSSSIRYNARPESHLAPVLADTGEIAAQFAYIGGMEAIYQNGPFSLQSEVVLSTVDASTHHRFWGAYASASWCLTGESRGYSRTEGVQLRLVPATPFRFNGPGWGALELALRYSYLDLADQTIDGGRMRVIMPALNWYWNEHVRWQFNCGFSRVEGGPSPGDLGILQTRLQVRF